ncbi:MAG: ATP-binding cassette domain-containing protein [Gammaproteobacteria bacterium]|nr:ATP-binding cassette domain-containing protein [Gammaproteobacteria bacterium]
MILFKNISLRRGARILFSDVNLTLHNGEKIGLVGDNGSGKSSLLGLLMSTLSADSGDFEINTKMKISHVAQETPHSNASALDYVIDGDKEFREVERKIDNLDHSDQNNDLSRLLTRMEDMDGYSIKSRAAKILSGLGFDNHQLEMPTRSFSGGWRVRLNLAQALICPSDILLLDEPTNHLDIDAIVWLETWLKRYKGTIILISHDREFIDGVCQRILHIDGTTIRSYTGNYTQFERTKAELLANEQAVYEKQQRQVQHMEDYIRRFRAQATKARQAQSRIKALEKMQLIAPAHVNSQFKFQFFESKPITDPILRLEKVQAGYGDNIVLDNLSLSFSSGDRIGLLGRNGAGKSTLIKVLANELALLNGNRVETKHLNIGYFAQHQLEQLDPENTPLQQIQSHYPKEKSQVLRTYLGGFGFHGDHINQLIGQFSGGEKARLALAVLIFKRPNLLLLDEPTNHLDIEIRHALTMAIQQYEGAIILVSHDRHLLNTVTDQLLLVHDKQVQPLNGDMSDYIKWTKDQRNNTLTDPSSMTSSLETQMTVSGKTENDNTQPASATSRKEKRQRQAQQREKLKPLSNKIKQLERKMAELQIEYDAISKILSDPKTFETHDSAQITVIAQKHAHIKCQLLDVETKWYETSDEFEQCSAELG